MNEEELAFYSGHQLRQLLINKQLSPVELTQLFLNRIERLNPTLHAFLKVTPEEALKAAKKAEEHIMKGQFHSPLLGIPIAITDTFHLKDYPTTFGSLLYKDDIAAEDSQEVKALKEAGAIILGKTNISEFLFYASAENRLMDPSCNPWNSRYSAGNSGTAAAVSAGLAPIGIAADMHAGTRMPSSFCGTFGLKPTRGRVPVVRKHLVPISEKKFYQKGPIARSVLDAAMTLDVLIHQEGQAPLHHPTPDYIKAITQDTLRPLRIGWSSHLGFIPVQPDVLTTIEAALSKLEELGHTVEKTDLQLDEGTLMHYRHILAADRLLPLLSLKKRNSDYFNLLCDYTQNWLKTGERVTGMEYSVGLVHAEWLKDEINRVLNYYDLIITPTVCVSSFLIPLSTFPQEAFGKELDMDLLFWAFMIPFSMSGHPAATIPCGITSEGFPIGMQVIGKYFSEDVLFQFAASLEKVFDWTSWRPATSVPAHK